MKPGMQRDLLVALWFLFDEFEIGENGGLVPAVDGSAPEEPPKSVKEAGKTKPRTNGAAAPRRRPSVSQERR